MRQLNIYGFERITKGYAKGGYTHQFFQRSDVSLCRLITRGAPPGGSEKIVPGVTLDMASAKLEVPSTIICVNRQDNSLAHSESVTRKALSGMGMLQPDPIMYQQPTEVRPNPSILNPGMIPSDIVDAIIEVFL